MISLDTNILARFLLNDDAEQFRAAWELLSQPGPYTAPPTVILELAWVLNTTLSPLRRVLILMYYYGLLLAPL